MEREEGGFWGGLRCVAFSPLMVCSPLLPKHVLHILIILISHSFKKALHTEAYHKIHYSSKEQRLDSILPPVIMWAAHVSKDVVNSPSLQALSIAYAAAKMVFGLVCVKSELLAEEFNLQVCTLAEEINLSFKSVCIFIIFHQAVWLWSKSCASE